MLVDTLGLVLCCVVHAADVQDRDGAKWVFAKATFECARLRIIRVDSAYAGQLVEWVRKLCGWTLEVIRRTSRGFVVLPKRWVVERTFAWLYKYRRLSKDYEYLPESSESYIYIAMIHLMVRRLE